jgi:cyanate lyase
MQPPRSLPKYHGFRQALVDCSPLARENDLSTLIVPGVESMISRSQLSSHILDAKRTKKLTFEALAKAVGRHPVWTAALCYGQASCSAEEAKSLLNLLGLSDEWAAVLQEPPLKGSLEQQVPVDPLIYRFHEITQVYGPAIKAVIHEMFGDGIMSAIDFEIDIQKQADPKGDRVIVIYNGKFLPYRKW